MTLQFNTKLFSKELRKINSSWLKEKMKEHQLHRTDLAKDLNVDSTTVSRWTTGSRPMSRTTKAMLHLYFTCFTYN